MLSYRHGFHAGNPADVFKHALLIQVIQAMQQKDKAFCYLDTHAGGGLYDLTADFAQKNREYEKGAGQWWRRERNTGPLRDYLQLIKSVNPGQTLTRYPGSPSIARQLLRPQDRMVLCERHGSELDSLRRLYGSDHQVTIHHRDGFEALHALLPPRERRALVLIDPPYELRDEPMHLARGLKLALSKFAAGVFIIWYPLLDGRNPLASHIKLGGIPAEQRQQLHYHFPPQAISGRMNGCGLLLINPPWHAGQGITRLCDELSNHGGLVSVIH